MGSPVAGDSKISTFLINVSLQVATMVQHGQSNFLALTVFLLLLVMWERGFNTRNDGLYVSLFSIYAGSGIYSEFKTGAWQ